MAESDFQAIPLMYAVSGLRDFFRRRPDVYVSGNLLLYYEEGNVDASVAPDVFVVFGVPNHLRPIYKVWEEGKSPDFVMEITSNHTRDEDQGPKRELYRSLGVPEYWQYDPTGDYLQPRLRCLSLVRGEYEELAEPRMGADGALVMYSAALGLEVRIKERDASSRSLDGDLRFRYPKTGRYILSYTESREVRQQAERAEQEEIERHLVEQAWQRAELARQQAELARRQAEDARHAAEARLEREVAARQAAAAQVAELQALLARQRERTPAPTPVREGRRPWHDPLTTGRGPAKLT